MSFLPQLLVLLAVTPMAEAKNFAFVLGGFSRSESKTASHDFIMPSAAASLCLKSAGYDVRTLIGGEDPLTAEWDNAKAYGEDYGFLRDQKIPFTPATQTNIEKQLSSLVQEVKAERAAGNPVKVEIVVNAHGNSVCERAPGAKPPSLSGLLGGGLPKLPPQECGLKIQVFDGQNIIHLDAKVFSRHVQELQKAGAEVNLNLNNCNAGAARKHFDSIPGVCAYYGSADQTLATGCVKGIPGDVEEGWWNSNTYVNMFRSCGGRFDELMDPRFKGYFSGNGCFTGLKKHIEENKIDLTSMASAYFSERRVSTSFEAPMLSCFDDDDLGGVGFAKAIQTKELFCEPGLDLTIEKLMGHLNDALLMEAWAEFDRAMGAYNKNLGRQFEILPQYSEKEIRDSLSAEEANRLAALEAEMKAISARLIAAERALFDRYYQLEPGRFAGCTQGACGRRGGS